MLTQTITLELPAPLYQSAHNIARITNRPIADIVRESLTNTLPPLDDLPDDEVVQLADMSYWDDKRLWSAANEVMSQGKQDEMTTLLDEQMASPLDKARQLDLQNLLDEYGQLMVKKSHAWLLLARRGYKVPVQG